MKKDIFIGGAWPYANYYLHVGHLAALLPGDVIAKYYRENGDNVIYVSGSDCHGTPITERAKKENIKPDQIAGHYHEEFKKTFEKIGFEYDEYSTTTSAFHAKYVQKYFLRLIENGYIYEKEELQDYCDNCNTFLSDREIVGTCPHCGGSSTGDQCDVCLSSLNSNEVLNKHCKTCGSVTSLKKNKHLYFKLPVFEKELQELIDINKTKWRKNALGEAQKYIDMGLVDRAATRQLNWGINVPVEGYSDKRIYVWIEAVLGYLTVGQEVADSRGIDFDKYMSNDNPNLVTYYVHGKDNIPFHTTIYAALVKGLKYNYRLPDYIVSSAYVNLNNEKMSKSKGNLITVNELLTMFNRDTLRFYFIFNGPELKDTNCSITEIIQVYNKFLVGVLGNFVNRNLSFIVKKFEGKIVSAKIDESIVETTKKQYQTIGSLIEKAELKSAINAVVDYISLGNKYYDEKQPWIQVKQDMASFNDTTYTCVYMMANIANLVHPFMPDVANKIKEILNLEKPIWQETIIKNDFYIEKAPLLFDRIDEAKFLEDNEIEL